MPKRWKVARVIPCHKQREKHDLSIISKVMEILLYSARKYVCRHSLVSDKLFGFRDGHFTGDVFTYIIQLYNAIAEKQEAI